MVFRYKSLEMFTRVVCLETNFLCLSYWNLSGALCGKYQEKYRVGLSNFVGRFFKWALEGLTWVPHECFYTKPNSLLIFFGHNLLKTFCLYFYFIFTNSLRKWFNKRQHYNIYILLINLCLVIKKYLRNSSRLNQITQIKHFASYNGKRYYQLRRLGTFNFGSLMLWSYSPTNRNESFHFVWYRLSSVKYLFTKIPNFRDGST